MTLDDLIIKEGWHTEIKLGQKIIIACGQEFPFTHPVAIHLKLYREDKNPETKYLHMKAAHDYLWPHTVKTWHYWTERRFRAHCEGWSIITLAGGASCAKSYDVAKIAALFWFANPTQRNVTIASVTLESLTTRVWGYLTKLIDSMAIELPYKYYRAAPPKFLYEKPKSDRRFKVEDDTMHGIFSVTAKMGDDDRTISTWIGKHPEDAMLLILDEATDMPPAILKALPNLNTKSDRFQMFDIGNSNSKFDLHGSLATPKVGWDNIDPLQHNKWETMQENAVCLYFNPYESPAIHDSDPVKRELLGEFLITKEQIERKEKELGKNSESFWRFVMGYWKSDSTETIVISRKFLDEYDPRKHPELSGRHPLRICAGLDPAFSTGGDQCILRLAVLGHCTDGLLKLDFRKDNLRFVIRIIPSVEKSAELQIADAVIEILATYRCPIANLAVDATGQGRALAEVIRLRANTMEMPFKIYSTQVGGGQYKSFDVIIKTSLSLYEDIRTFIQNGQICGLDDIAITQLVTRQIQLKNGKQVLESKQSFKTRMGAVMPSLARSPDEADGVALCLQAAILKHGFRPGQRLDMISRYETSTDEKIEAFNAQRPVIGTVLGSRGRPTVPNATFTGGLEKSANKKFF